MRVKIGNRWYDSSYIPICVQFTDTELSCVQNMDERDAPQRKFAQFPDDFGTREEKVDWMNDK